MANRLVGRGVERDGRKVIGGRWHGEPALVSSPTAATNTEDLQRLNLVNIVTPRTR